MILIFKMYFLLSRQKKVPKKSSPPASAPFVIEIANAQSVQQNKTGANVLEECISGRLFQISSASCLVPKIA